MPYAYIISNGQQGATALVGSQIVCSLYPTSLLIYYLSK